MPACQREGRGLHRLTATVWRCTCRAPDSGREGFHHSNSPRYSLLHSAPRARRGVRQRFSMDAVGPPANSYHGVQVGSVTIDTAKLPVGQCRWCCPLSGKLSPLARSDGGFWVAATPRNCAPWPPIAWHDDEGLVAARDCEAGGDHQPTTAVRQVDPQPLHAGEAYPNTCAVFCGIGCAALAHASSTSPVSSDRTTGKGRADLRACHGRDVPLFTCSSLEMAGPTQ